MHQRRLRTQWWATTSRHPGRNGSVPTRDDAHSPVARGLLCRVLADVSRKMLVALAVSWVAVPFWGKDGRFSGAKVWQRKTIENQLG